MMQQQQLLFQRLCSRADTRNQGLSLPPAAALFSCRQVVSPSVAAGMCCRPAAAPVVQTTGMSGGREEEAHLSLSHVFACRRRFSVGQTSSSASAPPHTHRDRQTLIQRGYSCSCLLLSFDSQYLCT